MRRKIFASLLVALGSLLASIFSFVEPVDAQEPPYIRDDGLCSGKGALAFEQWNINDVAKRKCSEQGVYDVKQPWFSPGGKTNPTNEVNGLSWDNAIDVFRKGGYNSGSIWFRRGAPIDPKNVTIGQINEPNGPGSFCKGTGPLTLNAVDTVDDLKSRKCSVAGTYGTFQTWHSPGGEKNVHLGQTGLSFEAALDLLKKQNDNSGSLFFAPASAAVTATPVPAAPSAPTRAPTAQPVTGTTPTAPTPVIVVVTATPQQQAAAAPVATPTPTKTPTDQGVTQKDVDLTPFYIGGSCLLLFLIGIGLIALALFLRRPKK